MGSYLDKSERPDMKKIRVEEFKNAYGIKQLYIDLEGGKSKELGNQIIYAPNGVFKTSFARAMKKLSYSKGSEVRDRVLDAMFKCKLEIDGVSYDESSTIENIIVYSRELLDEQDDEADLLSNNVDLKNLATSKDDIDLLNKLAKRIEPILEDFRSLLNVCDLSEAKLNKITKIEKLSSIRTLSKVIRALAAADEELNTSLICNKDFNIIKNLHVSTYEAIDSVEFKEEARSYVTIFNNTLKSIYFDEKFNDVSAQALLKALKDSEFLSEKRYIMFHGDEFKDYETFEKKIHEVIIEVSDKEELFNLRDSLIKKLGKVQEAETLKEAVRNNPLIVEVLSQGREGILFSHLKRNNTLDLEANIKELDAVELEEEQIRKTALENRTEFDKAIDEYIARFRPVFKVKITNKKTSLFDEEFPNLVFSHKDNDDKDYEESEFREILSSGEKTALSIIRFIVAYKRLEERQPIVILDDIVETFDYCNRAAFIQYIYDIVKPESCVIVLTHNYEFYRTLKSRVGLLDGLVAKPERDRVVVSKNKNIDMDISDALNVKDEQSFLHALPFVRELCCLEPKSPTDHLIGCFHWKEDTEKLTIRAIVEQINKRIRWFAASLKDDVLDKSYLETMNSVVAELKANTVDFFDVKKKLILAIACRVLLEQKIVDGDISRIDGITSNQTLLLLKNFKNQLSDISVGLLERVILYTPEFVHVNSFMYEPLVDIPPDYLLDLLEDIEALEADAVWK